MRPYRMASDPLHLVSDKEKPRATAGLKLNEVECMKKGQTCLRPDPVFFWQVHQRIATQA